MIKHLVKAAGCGRKLVDVKLLSEIGECLYGFYWQRDLARDLKVGERSMRYWVAGQRPIPNRLHGHLIQMLQDRVRRIEIVVERLDKVLPKDGEP